MNNKLLTIQYDNNIKSETGINVLDVTEDNIPDLREYNAFRKYCLDALYLSSDYSGLVSSKFENKTGLSINEALGYADKTVDIILFHPYPLELTLQNNFMQLAELEHPGITRKLNKLWYKIFGSDLPRVHLPENVIYCCHCNYFLANKKFWDSYSLVISKMDELFSNGELDEFLYDASPYNLRTDAEEMVSFFPFMFERLLTHYLYDNRDNFVVKNISLETGFDPVHVFKNEGKFVYFLKFIFFFNKRGLRNFKMTVATRIYYYVRKHIFNIRRLMN